MTDISVLADDGDGVARGVVKILTGGHPANMDVVREVVDMLDEAVEADDLPAVAVYARALKRLLAQ